jgi:hypothetical protein
MVKRILCYVHDTTRFALSFNTSSDLLLHGFNEFYWVDNVNDNKSMCAYTIYHGYDLIF